MSNFKFGIVCFTAFVLSDLVSVLVLNLVGAAYIQVIFIVREL